MPQGMVRSLKMKDFVPLMGNRGSKSVERKVTTVKEQRVDGFSFILSITVRRTLRRRETGSRLLNSLYTRN